MSVVFTDAQRRAMEVPEVHADTCVAAGPAETMDLEWTGNARRATLATVEEIRRGRIETAAARAAGEGA